MFQGKNNTRTLETRFLHESEGKVIEILICFLGNLCLGRSRCRISGHTVTFYGINALFGDGGGCLRSAFTANGTPQPHKQGEKENIYFHQILLNDSTKLRRITKTDKESGGYLPRFLRSFNQIRQNYPFEMG